MIDQRVKEESIRTLSAGSKSPFWQLLLQYMRSAGDTENFLAIKNEMGMKGFWYLKGYVKAMRDVQLYVEAADRKMEQILKTEQGRKP